MGKIGKKKTSKTRRVVGAAGERRALRRIKKKSNQEEVTRVKLSVHFCSYYIFLLTSRYIHRALVVKWRVMEWWENQAKEEEEKNRNKKYIIEKLKFKFIVLLFNSFVQRQQPRPPATMRMKQSWKTQHKTARSSEERNTTSWKPHLRRAASTTIQKKLLKSSHMKWEKRVTI